MPGLFWGSEYLTETLHPQHPFVQHVPVNLRHKAGQKVVGFVCVVPTLVKRNLVMCIRRSNASVNIVVMVHEFLVQAQHVKRSMLSS